MNICTEIQKMRIGAYKVHRTPSAFVFYPFSPFTLLQCYGFPLAKPRACTATRFNIFSSNLRSGGKIMVCE